MKNWWGLRGALRILFCCKRYAEKITFERSFCAFDVENSFKTDFSSARFQKQFNNTADPFGTKFKSHELIAVRRPVPSTESKSSRFITAVRARLIAAAKRLRGSVGACAACKRFFSRSRTHRSGARLKRTPNGFSPGVFIYFFFFSFQFAYGNSEPERNENVSPRGDNDARCSR